MKRAFKCLLAAGMLALILYSGGLVERLPVNGERVADEKYAGWSGVLRLWVCEGWDAGAAKWLNARAAKFERAHPGVYIQIKSVSEAALGGYLSAGAPDMLVFAPGMLSSADGLLPIEAEVRAEFGSESRAIPILMGGYCLIQAERGGGTDIAIREAERYSCWPAAAIALFAGEAQAREGAEEIAPEIDLGLAEAFANDGGAISPERLKIYSDAYRAFVKGEVGAAVANQRFIKRLASSASRVPDFLQACPGEAFTDQLLFFAVVRNERPEAPSREALCRDLLSALLSDESQTALKDIGAMRVTEGDAIYPSNSPTSQMELFYASRPLVCPGAFDQKWRTRAETLFELFAKGEISARAAFEALALELSLGR